MALMGFGVWSLVAQQLSGGIVSSFVLWTASDWQPQFRFSRKHLDDLFTFGINIVGINILGFLVTRGDNLLIGYFLGTTALGYYDLAYRLLLVVTSLFVGIISSTAMPIFSSIQGDLPRLRNVLYEFVELTNAIAFPVFLVMSVLAPELVIVIFGEQWKDSIPVMQILNIIGILYAGFYFNAPLIMAVGKPEWKLRLDICRTIFYVTAFFIAVRWGIVAVAASYVISAYIFAFATVWVIKKLININVKKYVSKYTTPLIGSLIMIFAMVLTRHILTHNFTSPYALLLIYSILVGFIVYSLSIWIIKPELMKKIIEVIHLSLKRLKKV
jgi:PST family polysaccharide transporter